MNFNIINKHPQSKITVLLALMVLSFSFCTHAKCSGQFNDISGGNVYLQTGTHSVTLMDVLSPETVRLISNAMKAVTCDKQPIYIWVKGEYIAALGGQFKTTRYQYNSLAEALSGSALTKEIVVTVTKPASNLLGAHGLDFFVTDDESLNEYQLQSNSAVAHAALYRPHSFTTDWTTAICNISLDDNVIQLPDAYTNSIVTKDLMFQILCDKPPTTFMSMSIIPNTADYDGGKNTMGLIYDKNHIKIFLKRKDNAEVGIPINTAFDITNRMKDNVYSDRITVESVVGPNAPSGIYSTHVILMISHN